MLGISPRKIQYKLKEYQQGGIVVSRARGGTPVIADREEAAAAGS